MLTAIGDAVVIISWTVDDRGSEILSFDVQIRESDGLTFTSE